MSQGQACYNQVWHNRADTEPNQFWELLSQVQGEDN